MVKTMSPSTVVTVLGCFVGLLAVRGQVQPAISTNTQGNVTVTGNDLTLGYSMGSISLRQLAADVDSLKQLTAQLQNTTAMFPTTEEVNQAASSVACCPTQSLYPYLQHTSCPDDRGQQSYFHIAMLSSLHLAACMIVLLIAHQRCLPEAFMNARSFSQTPRPLFRTVQIFYEHDGKVATLVDGAIADAMAAATAQITSAATQLDQRITANTATLAGLPQTQQAVSDLVDSVNYLLAHAQNVTLCAANGTVHAGDGSCVSPVPRCPMPTAPSGGSVSLSSDYIIPGVTATCVCPLHFS